MRINKQGFIKGHTLCVETVEYLLDLEFIPQTLSLLCLVCGIPTPLRVCSSSSATLELFGKPGSRQNETN